jgi:hypothetical protein
VGRSTRGRADATSARGVLSHSGNRIMGREPLCGPDIDGVLRDEPNP